MHIFLTGPLQSGKSTAIARYLVGRPEAPGGFRTHWDRAGGRLTLELLETGETLSVATMEPHGVRADRAAFDAAGERLLSAPAGRRSLLLMDELGFLERCSPVFQRAVFTLLDGPTPVLGVLRHLCNPERKRSKTIFTLLKSEQIPQMIEIINKVTGGLDKPDTGICFALPTTFVEGVNKNK